MDYIEEIRAEHPNIELYEEGDLYWSEEGLELLEKGEYEEALIIFKKTVSVTA